MPGVFLAAACLIFLALVFHAGRSRGWKQAALFTACALLFGLWHELNPLREADPEYFFAKAIKVYGIPVVGVIGWFEVIYLSWFVGETLFPAAMRTRILILPALLFALIASVFSLCIETTGIGMEWWIWREDRRHILYPMAGWATQALLFSSLYLALFHSTPRTRILLLVIMICVAPTFIPGVDRLMVSKFVWAAAGLLFIIFARFDPKSRHRPLRS